MGSAKKVILFIVEGPSEETAFGLIFERLFKDSQVLFDVVHGDITTEQPSGRNKQNQEPLQAKNRVRDRIVQHIKQRKQYRWNDLLRVVQITDADGVFVSDNKVVTSGESGIAYFENRIETDNVNAVLQRNKTKRIALRQLLNCDCLVFNKQPVPYRIYFLSRNMEHALHSRIEAQSNQDKYDLARSFQRTFQNDLPSFIAFLQSEGIAVAGDYLESWKYLEQECHSLEQHSNLHLALP